MTLDTKPGSYASEKENFYFSCNTENSVLVGIMEKGNFTCPVLGIETYMIPINNWLLMTGNADTQQIPLGNWNEMQGYLIRTTLWRAIVPSSPLIDQPRVLVIETDHGAEYHQKNPLQCVIRLHQEFE